ncbi:MAG: hypothetical protein CMP21_02270 [Rickettsiales bacterium]|nr:hypothetical protein [Rickettsiales bacterium]MBE33618.1 hypothetical protein [bacterium]
MKDNSGQSDNRHLFLAGVLGVARSITDDNDAGSVGGEFTCVVPIWLEGMAFSFSVSLSLLLVGDSKDLYPETPDEKLIKKTPNNK